MLKNITEIFEIGVDSDMIIWYHISIKDSEPTTIKNQTEVVKMTKRKYSTAQKLYMTAKANLQLAEEKHNAAESAYIKAKGITNPDGTTPERIYMIDDENTFETVSAEFDETAESKTTREKLLEAKKIFKDAETNLLDYALNVVPVPAKEREILTRSAETNYTTRKKIIDLVVNLDASTVPAI